MVYNFNMLKNITNNENKFAFVTGATGGLGNSFCRKLAEQKYNLLLTGTNSTKLENFKKQLLESHSDINIITFACDLSIIEDREKLLKFIDDKQIQINFFVCNAGYITEGSIENCYADTLIKCIRVNCEGNIHLTKEILDRRNPKELMQIICVTSLAANYPMPYMAIYSATKALLKSFMQSLSFEYKDKNVNVLIVEPGAIETSEKMIEAIKAQGVKGKLSVVQADIIASNSIKKSLKNKKQYIPGFFNKMTLFISNLAPTRLRTNAVGKMWKKSQQKRNIK